VVRGVYRVHGVPRCLWLAERKLAAVPKIRYKAGRHEPEKLAMVIHQLFFDTRPTLEDTHARSHSGRRHRVV